MRVLTKRFDSVRVATLASLRERLDELNAAALRFTVEKVRGDRVILRAEKTSDGKRMEARVVLPSYPTGHEHDVPANPNVVLDPVDFPGATTCEERSLFAPLLGQDAIEHYEKLHVVPGLTMTRCC